MIHLDHHAAEPLCPEARAAMLEALESGWANPASVHAAGRRARAMLERARAQLARATGADPQDVVFVSGGTEACDLGVRGLVRGARLRRIVTTRIEHPALLETIDALVADGVEVVRVPAPGAVPPDPDRLAGWLDAATLLAFGWVHHETGAITDAVRLARAARERGAMVFVDATQALGKLAVDVERLGADAVAFSSPKIGGPAGAGALWVRREAPLEPVLRGGGQERGRRAGTPSVVALAGFGAAAAAIDRRLEAMPRVEALRDELEGELVRRGAHVNGVGAPRVGTVTCVSWPEIRGEQLVAALDLEGICVSSGPACSSGRAEPSRALREAFPDEPWRARGAVRFSLGPASTREEIRQAVLALDVVLARRLLRHEPPMRP
ncbi:MAG: aminotransferase class V-fold PLP-dependent enzyme [Myxococcota bacterium]|nr:aminotransferase class V-fold PLP-dependent enzyme [Myxococcota bacterium]MDW8361043.1 aminotransferase class V-fold PLP-dependent enzyme [Myxococcales bacterium]